MNFEFYTIGEAKWVYITPDEDDIKKFSECGKPTPKAYRTKVIVDKYDKECFVLQNWTNPRDDNKHFMFTRHIQDAVEEILYGKGDRIEVMDIMGAFPNNHPTHFRVYRYVDREFGNSMKEESQKAWRTTNFGFSLIVYDSEGIVPMRFVTKDLDYWNGIDNRDVLTFYTRYEAQQMVDRIVELSKKFGDRLKPSDHIQSPSFENPYHNMSDDEEFPMMIRYGSGSGYIFDYQKLKERDKKITEYFIIQIIQDVMCK